MKGDIELHRIIDEVRSAMSSATIWLVPSNPEHDQLRKEALEEKLAYLIAALEVFTDLNFTEEEQSRLFNISAQRLKELEEKFK
jgi:hypothetical protein